MHAGGQGFESLTLHQRSLINLIKDLFIKFQLTKIILTFIIFKCKKKNYLVIMALRVTPVPIPNTMVKPFRANGTAGVALWKSRLLPD